MPNFYEYNREQGYLLPPSVKDVLGENHLCFFLHRVVEKLDLREFEAVYGEEGQRAYHRAMPLKVWLYAYALGMTSSRRLEERIKEDLGFRFLAGGAQPDYWAWNDFRRRQGRAMNDVFTQVVERARSAGLGKLGHVAIDSTRIAANAAKDSVERIEKLRGERAKIRKRIRRWQRQCDGEAPNEGPGTELGGEERGKLGERLQQIPRRIERLKKSGMKKLSRVDQESRFLRDRQGFTLGYRATLAVSEDHLIVAQQVGQASTDNDLLVPLVDQVERQCGQRPGEVSADSGFFSLDNLHQMEERKIEAYVPDTNLARVLNRGGKWKQRACDPAHRRMRRKLRSRGGQQRYRRRREVVEPVWGVLKEQRGMRPFRMRGLAKVAIEFTFAATALNLTRLWRVNPNLRRVA